MTDKEKLEKIKALADKMYSRMAYLTSDTRPIRQAMEDYHQFIINEYHKEESVSEELNTVAIEYANNITEKIGYRLQLRRAVCFGAKWKKERLMANAVDIEVKVDAGGYPYIPQMELYDYEKDIPLAKEGDKYKVVLIKED